MPNFTSNEIKVLQKEHEFSKEEFHNGYLPIFVKVKIN